MNRLFYSSTDLFKLATMEQSPDLRHLLHRLNNQLGIVLAHAELMENKAADDASRTRAGQIVTSILDAMGTTKEIGVQVGTLNAQEDL